MSSRLQNTRDFHRHCTDYLFFLKWSPVKRIFELSTFFGAHAATGPPKTPSKLKAWLVFRSLRYPTLAAPIFAVSAPILKPRKLRISPESELYREHNF